MLDTRTKNEQQDVEGFRPNVVNEEREADAKGGGKFGYALVWILCCLTVIGGICMIAWRVKKGNWFRQQQETINNAASGIDVQLKKRRDTLIKLVDATQSSIKFEKSLLTDITSLRNINHFSAQDKNTQKLDYVAHGLIGQLENYPNLKTTDTIRDLMQSANIIENEIAATRRLYNQAALEFNREIQAWPGTCVASKMKLHSFALFAASDTDRQDVSLKMSA